MYNQFLDSLERVRWVCSFFLQTYRYRVELTHASSARDKLPHLVQSFWRTFVKGKRVLFYPDGPREFHAIYKLLKFLGYRYTSDAHRKCDVAIKWWLAFDGNPFAPEQPIPLLNGRNGAVRVLNENCSDISKTHVSSRFEEVFGYSLRVDPRVHSGKCLMKANWNALHIGQIIECPTEPREGDFVYQRLIRNEVEDGLVEDMRVPIFGDKIPFVYLKYRPVGVRFVDRSHTNKKARIVEVAEVLSVDELGNIYRFCKSIGLDYGEIDVLRDRGDGRIYIVDANNTPSGPPTGISDDERKTAVLRLAHAFREAFQA